MALVPFLDIIAGLEEAFFKIFQFSSATTQDKIILRRSSPARRLYSNVARRSLFVKWQDLYNGFDSGRKASWEAYWVTLPFSDHGGGGGWPGSGYSAFIYVNAPRYQLGLDLLFDPPVENLVYNGNFALGSLGWNNNNWTFASGDAYIISAPEDNFILLDIDHYIFSDSDFTYTLEFDYVVLSGAVYGLIYDASNGSVPYSSSAISGSGHFSHSGISVVNAHNFTPYFQADPDSEVYIDNVVIFKT